MRRLLLLWLALGLIAGTLAGCAEETTPEPESTPIPSPTPLPPDLSVPERILARGHLVVGVRYDLPPFCYVTDEGTLAGFDIDLAHELAQRWLGDPEAVRFRQVRSDTAADHLQAGDVDLVLAALTHTQPREEQIDFGPPYFLDGQALLIRQSDVPSITTPADLGGRLVASLADAGVEEELRAAVEFTPTVQTYPDFNQALAALHQDQVDAVAGLRRRLVRDLGTGSGTTIVGQYTQAAVAPAYVHGEPGMANLVALTLEEMYADGSLYDLYYQWFPGDTAPSPDLWPGTATLSLEEAAAVSSSISAMEAIQSGGWLRVALVEDRSPFAYLDGAGEPAGYEVQLVRLMADRWLGDRTAVDFLPVTLEDGLDMLTQGEVDMIIGAIPHTRERELEVDFSLTTYVDGVSLMVQAGSPLGGLPGLDGQPVAAEAGTDSADVLQRVGREGGFSIIIFPQPSLEDAVEALKAGEVVAIVGERTEMLAPAYSTPGIGVTADRLTRVPLALALPPGDSEFRDLVNLTLQAMAQDGTFSAVYGEWFDDPVPTPEPWPGQPTRSLRVEVATP